MTLQIEHTDTFGGEANYCWVKRARINADLKRPAIVRKVKAWAGWTGHRCEVYDHGDMMEIRPRGICQIIFVNWIEDEFARGEELA
jgi:hypothetical protein